MIKLIAVTMIVLAVCSAGAFAAYAVGSYFDNKSSHNNGSFDECVASGYSVIQVYPGICVDSDGNTYAEQYGLS